MEKERMDFTDYTDPICPFCTDQFKKQPPVRPIPTQRVLEKLDEHLGRNDYDSAERHLLYWLDEAKDGRDKHGMLTVENELMGLYRKTNRKENALESVRKAFDEAEDYYNKAINVMSNNKNGELEIAITYLNLCDLNEAKLGSEQSEKIIDEYIEKAYELLNRDYLPRNGYYAFVCEKCAPTFGYFGRFLYQKELSDRARCIYERN